MKVRDLLQQLECCDPDASVILVTGKAWPMESRTEGVVTRGEVLEPGESPSDDCSPDDVLLLEGAQIRYGSKAVWQKVLR